MKYKNQNRLPVIGISATLSIIESGSFIGRERTMVGYDYVGAVRLAGGNPIILPIIEGKELIQQQVQLIDGLLLSGGYDICPFFYKEEPQPGLEAFRPDRDLYEIQLAQMAKALQKPILGICRGIQLLNTAFGGSLYQDISRTFPSALQHNQKAKPEEASHTVTLQPNTKLQRILEEDVVLTNSFHHQSIKNIAPGFIANAYTQDGIIEGIEGEDLFILGVQWHPELMFSKHPYMFKIFQAFIEETRQRAIT